MRFLFDCATEPGLQLCEMKTENIWIWRGETLRESEDCEQQMSVARTLNTKLGADLIINLCLPSHLSPSRYELTQLR